MQISNSDLVLLEFLECIEATSDVPDGCGIDELMLAGLAKSVGTKHRLTNAGKVRLKNLKSVLKGDERLPW